MKRVALRRRQVERDPAGQRGFTVIETCIALVILMIVGLGVASLFLFSIRNNAGAGNRALVLAVGQQQLEELRGVTYSNLETAVTAGGGTSKTVTVAGQPFTVATSFAYSPAGATSATATMKTITIDVNSNAKGNLAWITVPVRLVMIRSTSNVGSYSK
jgi:Tfp pilus assembly protein PilV